MSNVVTTTCKHCIWAEYASGTQTGCKFNRIEKFKERGVGVKLNIDTEDSGLIENMSRNHYTVERFCNACRDQNWADQYDDPMDKCLEQMQVQYDLVIPIQDTDLKIEDIENILKEVINKTPNSVHFVFPEAVAIKPYLVYFNEYFKDVCKVYYTQSNETDMLRLVNQAVAKCTGMYYLLIDPKNYAPLPEQWYDKLDWYINDELYPIIMVRTHEDNHNGLLVHRRVHVSFGGNTDISIEEKVDNMVLEQEIEDAIKVWGNDG